MLTNEQIKELRRLEEKMDNILKNEGFTPEYESMLYSIAEFCCQNNISSDEYNKMLWGDAIC